MDKSLHFPWDVITHPWPNFNGGLSKPLLKLEYEWVIISHGFMCA